MNNHTNFEQSKTLLERGVKPSSADMYFKTVYHGTSDDDMLCFGKLPDHGIVRPVWSAAALLNIIPKTITDGDGAYTWTLRIDTDEWENYYLYYHNFEALGNKIMDVKPNTSLTNAAYDMIMLLLDEGYHLIHQYDD